MIANVWRNHVVHGYFIQPHRSDDGKMSPPKAWRKLIERLTAATQVRPNAKLSVVLQEAFEEAFETDLAQMYSSGSK